MSWGNAISSGASGAATGSMFGPWGTVIGGGIGLAMGAMEDDDSIDIEKLLGGDLKKLRSRADTNTALAQDLTGKGDQALAPVLDYYRKLLSGNPAAVAEATAADRGRVIDQYDGARRAMATFAPRGGGQTVAAGNSRVSQANDLAEILSTARSTGAEGSMKVGGQYLAAGGQANALAGQDLNSVINAVLSQTGLQMQQQQTQHAQSEAQGEAMGQLIGLMLTKNRGGGSAGGLQGGGAGYFFQPGEM